MRCAQDGRHFAAVFKRDAGSRKFTIERLAPSSPGKADAGSAEMEAYNTDAYDFTGFYCPCCGFTASSMGAVCQCGRCSDLVCQALVYDKLDSASSTVRWFICHPECGSEGPITSVLQEIQASRKTTIERAAAGKLASPGPAPLRIANR